jgi:hypothetical protein
MDATGIEVVHRQLIVVGAKDDQRIGELGVIGPGALKKEPLSLEPFEVGLTADEGRAESRVRRLDRPRADERIQRLERVTSPTVHRLGRLCLADARARCQVAYGQGMARTAGAASARSVGIAEEGDVTDAGVEALAVELDALGLELSPSGGDVRHAKRLTCRAGRERLADACRIEDVERHLAGTNSMSFSPSVSISSASASA